VNKVGNGLRAVPMWKRQAMVPFIHGPASSARKRGGANALGRTRQKRRMTLQAASYAKTRKWRSCLTPAMLVRPSHCSPFPCSTREAQARRGNALGRTRQKRRMALQAASYAKTRKWRSCLTPGMLVRAKPVLSFSEGALPDSCRRPTERRPPGTDCLPRICRAAEANRIGNGLRAVPLYKRHVIRPVVVHCHRRAPDRSERQSER